MVLKYHTCVKWFYTHLSTGSGRPSTAPWNSQDARGSPCLSALRERGCLGKEGASLGGIWGEFRRHRYEKRCGNATKGVSQYDKWWSMVEHREGRQWKRRIRRRPRKKEDWFILLLPPHPCHVCPRPYPNALHIGHLRGRRPPSNDGCGRGPTRPGASPPAWGFGRRYAETTNFDVLPPHSWHSPTMRLPVRPGTISTCRTVRRPRQWTHQTPATVGESRERTQASRLTTQHQPKRRPDAQADAYGRHLGNAVKHRPALRLWQGRLSRPNSQP